MYGKRVSKVAPACESALENAALLPTRYIRTLALLRSGQNSGALRKPLRFFVRVGGQIISTNHIHEGLCLDFASSKQAIPDRWLGESMAFRALGAGVGHDGNQR